MQWNTLVTHETHVIKLLKSFNMLYVHKYYDKDFLLKIYLEIHELKVDGNADQCISMPITITMWKQSKI